MSVKELLFDEASHTYSVDGSVVPSVTDICAPLTIGKYPNVGSVSAAAARGSRIHELCALYDMDALPDEIEIELIGYIQAWIRFCRDYKPQWLWIERQLYADNDGAPFAGTVDRVGIIDGFPLVVDIKSAASLDRAAKVSLVCQMRGYKKLCRQNGINVEGAGLGVQVKKDGTYTLHWGEKIQKKYSFFGGVLFDDLRKIYRITKGR